MAKRICGKEMKCLQAITTGKLDIVKKLTTQLDELKADISLEHVMILAARSGNVEMMKYLQQYFECNDISNTIVMAAQDGHIDMVKYILENGGDINTSNGLPLKYAASNNKFEMVKFLLEKGADIGTGGQTALVWCAGQGNLKMVQFLVDNGADVMDDDNAAYKEAKHNRKTAVANYLRKKAEEYIELTSSE